jgi:tRNA dimethylallyltransferase
VQGLKPVKKIIVLSGPTASGKTSTSIKLAKLHGLEIINFDSLLFYRELSIGTAKPTTQEMDGVPHHLIGTESIKRPINAATFFKNVIPIIETLLEKNITPLLVGGSGFYLQTILEGMYDSQTTPIEISKRSDKLYQDCGISPFIEELKIVDPTSMNKLHSNDHYRVRRALEHYWATGQSFSDSKTALAQKKENGGPYLFAINKGWEVLHLYLDIPKSDHQKVIKERIENMLEYGFKEEVQSLLNSGFTGEEKPLQSVGYKQMQDYLNGKLTSTNDLKEKILIATRRLAKSQRTWFNKIKPKRTFNPLTDIKEVTDTVDSFMSV